MWDSLFYGRLKRVHFIGIGGVGMSGIAEVLLNIGLDVHGSDIATSETTEHLKKLGATIYLGHNASNISGADVVIVSSAIDTTNPEVIFAHAHHIPVIPRAEMLGELMRLRHGIAISGSHGKTTTTSLVAALLQKANLDPTIVIGGRVNHLGSNARLGSGHFIVAEADESDGSFLLLSPSIAVVTNIDPEHLDYWTGGLEQIKENFTEFANRIPFFGLVVACVDDANVRSIMPNLKRRIATYGIEHDAKYMATNIVHDGLKTHFTVIHEGVELGRLTLPLVGRHNVLNALAAIAVGFELEVDIKTLLAGFENFTGVQRRFTLVGEAKGISVVDDYGHHPTEIKAVLDAARLTFPDRRLVVLFQPHRYSRTSYLFDDFCTAFQNCDNLIVSDIYPAGEAAIEGIDSQTLTQAIAKHRPVHFGGNLEDATNTCMGQLQGGDVVITLGAGTVTRSAQTIFKALQA
jgi:UDP-N-acetylmuramate--alanine ligase